MSYSPEEIKKWKMWDHYCTSEKTEMGVGKGEPCNWCGLTEEEYFEQHSTDHVKEWFKEG